MNVTNIYLSKHEDVKELAERIGTDIGSLEFLTTENKKNVVVAINELKSIMSSVENNLGDYPTKQELTQAITDLIDGADTDSDTLKELADKITALAQADNGLVSALEAQEFSESQKQQARDNIDAATKSDIPDISGLATKAESDTNYYKKATTYTRTEMDSRYYTKTTADSTFAKVWTGTLTQYNAITTKDDNTIYIVT